MRHYLTGQHFTLITDQKAVSFMFDQSKKGKIENDKIMSWRTELSCHNFDIQYRLGKDNIVADCLSRNTAYSCSTLNSPEKLVDLHKALCHPGLTRMIHFIRARNLPYSMNDVKKITKSSVSHLINPLKVSISILRDPYPVLRIMCIC